MCDKTFVYLSAFALSIPTRQHVALLHPVLNLVLQVAPGKQQEDVLQGGLRQRVVLDEGVDFLGQLHGLEERVPRGVRVGHVEVEVVLVLVLDLAVGEAAGHVGLERGDAGAVEDGGVGAEQLDDDGEALAELVLQVLGAAEAAELALDHDGDPVAEGLALLHAV